jgi:hypothetical protein
MSTSTEIIQSIYDFVERVDAFEKPGMLRGILADDELHRIVDELHRIVDELKADAQEVYDDGDRDEERAFREAFYINVIDPTVDDIISHIEPWVHGRVRGLKLFLLSIF